MNFIVSQKDHCYGFPAILFERVMLLISTLNIVSISQTAEFLLTGCIPCVEANLSIVGVECDRMNWTSTIDACGRDIPSTPRVAIYFFSNSPVRCRLTKVVYNTWISSCKTIWAYARGLWHTFPVPPTPTSTSLNVGMLCCACWSAIMK